MKIVLFIISQENLNWKAKKKKKGGEERKTHQKNITKNRQSSQGILMTSHLFMCRFVDEKRGRVDVSDNF